MNTTDSQLNARFQGTALYATLLSILPREHKPEGYHLSPAQASAIPSQSTISSRLPGMSPDEMELLTRDYRTESSQLDELNLEDVYDRVQEIVMQDIMWGSAK